MLALQNEQFSVEFDKRGTFRSIRINSDEDQMNWLVDRSYVERCGFPDEDKLFGMFELKANGIIYTSHDAQPTVRNRGNEVVVEYTFGLFTLAYFVSVGEGNTLKWRVMITNLGEDVLSVDSFYIWFSLAYEMFRDSDVFKNMNHSCALFPFISQDFSKFAAVRRSNKGPHLGVYNTLGRTLSLGSYCRYRNNFAKQVSPSLDGVIYHSLVLAGKGLYENTDFAANNWIYPDVYNVSIPIQHGERKEWEYVFVPFDSMEQFYKVGLGLGYPVINYSPVTIKNAVFKADVKLPPGQKIHKAWFERQSANKTVQVDISPMCRQLEAGRYTIEIEMEEVGENKLVIQLDNGKQDWVVFNVLEPISNIIEARADYLCKTAFLDDKNDENCYAFRPVSNQGESLGKISFLLMKNLVTKPKLEEIYKAEQSATYYVKNKWFVNGDFSKPKKLYGKFYRIFDFDYIAYSYYLLSRFEDSLLMLNEQSTYLRWAAEILIMRFDESLHDGQREKTETRLTGIFTHYIIDLLTALKQAGMEEQEKRLSSLWKQFWERIKYEAKEYKGAITEHFFDNAGFGPTCEALCLSGCLEEAERYGELILANIGISNDYRSQNPDRWWESLSYMVHSLWGGLVSRSALVAFEYLKNTTYLEAAYRSTMPIFLCYDWNVVSTQKRLSKGEAASTFSVANPNMNKPFLSHNRFGQSVFKEDEAFLADNATGDDWDMGQELAAYLSGFGTKTFLYYENNELKCINGSISEEDGKYKVSSYAAYPKEYYLINQNISFVAEDGAVVPAIIFDGERMYKSV